MVRLVGVDLPKNKRIAYALTYIHGIGITSAKKIIEMANIKSETRTDDLTTEEIISLRQALEETNLKLEGDLRRFTGLNIKRLNEIVIEENDIEIIYRFVVNELELMLALDEEQKKLLLIRKNKFIFNSI